MTHNFKTNLVVYFRGNSFIKEHYMMVIYWFTTYYIVDGYP